MIDQKDIDEILDLVNRIKPKSLNKKDIQLVRRCSHDDIILPKGKIGIYSFFNKKNMYKIGKVGRKSNARFEIQHYNHKSSKSNLAKSLIKDNVTNEKSVKDWIRKNLSRTDILIDDQVDRFVLNFIEVYLHLKYNPKYEKS